MPHSSRSFGAALAASAAILGHSVVPDRSVGHVRMSRHAERWGKGAVRLSDYSSLRKLMRAARRAKLPSERLGIIDRAAVSAMRRAHVYFNSSPRKRYGR